MILSGLLFRSGFGSNTHTSLFKPKDTLFWLRFHQFLLLIQQKSNHIVTNHGVNRQMSKNSTEWFRANGFYGGALTTMRRKSIRTVYYNQIDGDMAHCSVFDMHNNVLILDEAVINGGRYKIVRYGEYIFLDNQGNSIDTRQTDTHSTRSGLVTMPSAIELSGTTTESYWKDYQLLGLYNFHETRNGAPAYKRARNAFLLGRFQQTLTRFFHLYLKNHR